MSFIAKKEGHKHTFTKVKSKVVPVRKVVNEKGKITRDVITARDTVYYYECSGKECEATQAFHMKRREI